ncbi:iron uptake transporter deferrochelatase/peroxidase subunit [Acidisphaera sp. L21]|uniref:iron uptake transporter deferrochelatase/peroxidase subunit n=1 Tax=Acidisphaera sp. L21 TaxID=1641851 RepID=UPI00131BED60|nr:iron uptake transporter deferrochelatase/peroxidase subunit [Acidisphaera sp. L21]
MAGCPFASRRGFLGAATGFVAALGTARAADTAPANGVNPAGQAVGRRLQEPFFAPHQGGIVTARQNHTYFATFDLVTDKPSDLVTLLRNWTAVAARLSRGEDAAAPAATQDAPGTDTGETAGLDAARLTITFGFGPGMFEHEGKDRYGLKAKRPEALVDLPKFNGDQLEDARTGGDLSVQACADDPQVAFHAVRQMARLAKGVAVLRWTQTGFTPNAAAEDTPRNLMGFRDGTQNPVARRPTETAGGTTTTNPASLEDVVWVGDEGPAWMRNGSYMVVRRIRMALEHWDDTDVSFQEETIGRHKASGAPIGGKSEFDPIDLDAMDADGNPLIAQTAHVRLAAAASNDGAQLLRRAFSYNDGTNITAERWPPWRQGLEYDAGLLFICYQRDPRASFIKMFETMSKLDMLNQYTTHTGSGLFAIPPGAEPGGFIGQGLF